MLFNSYIFILLFLPLALLGYYGLNSLGKYKLANGFLLGMSLWFYGYFHPAYLLILCLSIAGNFLLAKAMQALEGAGKKALLILGICANIGVIFYYKYFNFFLENVNALFGASFTLRNILLPLGISFFTFQQVSFLIDSYRGETKDYSFGEYALFVAFFPQLVAGPIVLHHEMIPQFRDPQRRQFSAEWFSHGLFIFSLGLFKKVIIADTFGKAVTWGFGMVDEITAMEAWLVSFSYTFQLFFDFSGYCDMALGIGKMFHIELPQNFNSPYRAESIPDFWSRWHMTLTRFLRTYVYFPLGGSRKGTLRTYGNILVVFLISGLWHGANWTFVLWGALHGLLNCLTRIFKKQWERLGHVTRWALTFLSVNALWVVFRADSISQAALFLRTMLYMKSFAVRQELYKCFYMAELEVLESHVPLMNLLPSRVYGWHMWLFLLGALFAVLNLPNSKTLTFRPNVWTSFLTMVFLVWSIVSLSGISVFLYFNF